jgi:hypothetical protein
MHRRRCRRLRNDRTMSNAQHWIARKGQPLQGSLTIPGDK